MLWEANLIFSSSFSISRYVWIRVRRFWIILLLFDFFDRYDFLLLYTFIFIIITLPTFSYFTLSILIIHVSYSKDASFLFFDFTFLRCNELFSFLILNSFDLRYEYVELLLIDLISRYFLSLSCVSFQVTFHKF